jgi:hypothetical protein
MICDAFVHIAVCTRLAVVVAIVIDADRVAIINICIVVVVVVVVININIIIALNVIPTLNSFINVIITIIVYIISCSSVAMTRVSDLVINFFSCSIKLISVSLFLCF